MSNQQRDYKKGGDINEFDRRAYGHAGDEQDHGRKSGRGADVLSRSDLVGLRREGGHSAQDVYDYAYRMQEEHGTKWGSRSQEFLDKLKMDIEADGGPTTDTSNDTFEQAAPTLSPDIANALERIGSYNDRAWSGKSSQDIFGSTPVRNMAGAWGIASDNQAYNNHGGGADLAADTAVTNAYFDADSFKLNFKDAIKDKVFRTIGAKLDRKQAEE